MKKKQRGEMHGEMQRAKRGGQLNVTLGLGLKNILFILAFFLSVCLVELIRFDSVQSASDFRNQNRTEPKLFIGFLIS